jgi:AAA domain, putative AbiEii toxin, Type IV TA system
VEEEFAIEYDLSLFDIQFRVLFANRPPRASQARTLRKKRGAPEVTQTAWAFRVGFLVEGGRDAVLMASSPKGVKIHPSLGLTEPTPVRDPLRDASPMHQAIDVLGTLAEESINKVSDDTPMNEVASAEALVEFYSKAVRFQHHVAQHGGRFDEGLGTFGGIVSDVASLSVEDARNAMLLYYKADPNEEDDEDRVGTHFMPGDVASAALQHIKTSGVADVTLPEAELPFLRRALDLIGGKEAKMILKLQKESSPEDGGDATFGDFEFLITMEDGSVFRHDYLSYGQKRLLSFLYYAAANPDIIIADELVNGLHHEWIDACLDEVKDRQCFLTSQNPLLLDYLSFDSAEEVQRTFLLCDRRREGKRTQLVWQHMDSESADSFFRAYRAGVQHVSEILRTKGLW